MPNFLAGTFALAGAIAALGPVLIHLLNRRRRREIPWGAMELLREASVRTRRSLRLRDVALLILRTACVLLFGLALAQPYFSAGREAVDRGQPVHAIVIVDNSLSMAYAELGETLLDRARTRAGEFLDRLPDGSRISIIPLCDDDLAGRDDLRSAADAREALARIRVADRAGSVARAVELARAACQRVPELSAKRIAFLGDQQQSGWPAAGLRAALDDLPEFQIVPVQAREVENAWVSDLSLRDELADGQSAAEICATVRYDGPGVRNGVVAALDVDGIRVAEEIVDLSPGQPREVRFMHQFTGPGEGNELVHVPVSVSLTPDRLPIDDCRSLVVPVVERLPIVFVDQFGADGEDPRRNRFGETYPLRRLLAPGGSPGGSSRAGAFPHMTIDRLDRRSLRDARLVVVAGVESPGDAVGLLREFVVQGGGLVIAAGGQFSPATWTEVAWLDGAGILPAPLDAEFAGRLPDASRTPLEPFLLSPATMADEFFAIGGASRQELDELYRTPIFFQAARARLDDSSMAAIDRDANAARPAPPERWLGWALEPSAARQQGADTAAPNTARPQVLAAFSNGLPLLIRRDVGQGTIVLATSGVGSDWNNLPRTNAVLLFDRLLRQMLMRTFPRRNFETFEQPEIPIPADERRDEFRLEGPDGSAESPTVGALGPDRFGVVLRHLEQRGTYRLLAERPAERTVPGAPDRQPARQIPLAAAGPSGESDLAVLDEAAIRERVEGAAVAVIPPGGAIGVEGTRVRGQQLWKWLLGGTFVLLLAETAVLILFRPRRARAARRETFGTAGLTAPLA